MNSIKTKILVPSLAGMALALVALAVYGVVNMTTLSNQLSNERIDTAALMAYSYIGRLSERTQIGVFTVSSAPSLVALVQNWNANIDRAGVRQALMEYLAVSMEELGLDSFVVFDQEGVVILRTHDFPHYGDSLFAAPHVAAALGGITNTFYFSTPVMPMGLTSATPVRGDGAVIGAISAVTHFFYDEFVDAIAKSFNGEVSVFTGSTRVATTLRTPAGQRIVGTELENQEIVEAVLGRGESRATRVYFFGVPHLGYYFPLSGVDGNPIGMFFIGLPHQHIEHLSVAAQRNMTIFTIVAVALMGIAMFFFIGRLVKPLHTLADTLNDIAHGEGDLTARVPEIGNDEVAKASRYFNQTIGKIRELVVSIKREVGVLSEIGNDLTINMTETASAMNEIAANIQSIQGRVMNQSASVTQTNSTMGQVTSNITKLSEHVESQSAAVSESSSAIEEMIANIQSVTTTLAQNAVNVKELQESSETGKSSLQDVANDIQEIAKQSEGLLEINLVMENIASQTNLLSMNAAIEAAHAGDSGRGFAVVAEEIRKLAESSSEQSKTTTDLLKKIKESIDKITSSKDKVMSRFAVINNGVKIVAEQEENIRNAMDEQTQGSKQILQSASFVHDITQHVKTGSEKMREGSREVIHESQNLEKATEEIASGMNEMAVGAEQVNRAVASVSDLTSRTKDNISSLAQAVSRFKV